jgi:hypothetical protein
METSCGVRISDYTALNGISKWLLYRQVSVLYLRKVGEHVSGLP